MSEIWNVTTKIGKDYKRITFESARETKSIPCIRTGHFVVHTQILYTEEDGLIKTKKWGVTHIASTKSVSSNRIVKQDLTREQAIAFAQELEKLSIDWSVEAPLRGLDLKECRAMAEQALNKALNEKTTELASSVV